MTVSGSARRPGIVTFAVVVLYVAGIAEITLGVFTIFLRYTAEAQAAGSTTPTTLLGAGMIIFGLLVIGLASGVARGSRFARIGASVVIGLGLLVAIAELLVAADGDWSGVIVETLASAAVIPPLWSPPAARFFAKR